MLCGMRYNRRMLPPAENDVLPFAHEPAPPVMQPRLGIVHLMAWVFFSCLWLAMHRSAGSSLDMWPENFRAVMFVASIVQAIIAGAALGGVALWLWRLYRGGPRFPDQPGHYLFWVNGVVVAASIPISMLIQAFSSPSLILVLGLSTLQGAALALIAMIPLAATTANQKTRQRRAGTARSGTSATDVVAAPCSAHKSRSRVSDVSGANQKMGEINIHPTVLRLLTQST